MLHFADRNIQDRHPLPAPAELLLAAQPRTGPQGALIARSRQAIQDILAGRDPRLLVVVGPCSIHDVAAGREYGQRLAALAGELEDRLLLVMRAYFEKPRTSTGWTGLIYDPALDGSGDPGVGLRLARQFLGEMLDLGLPTATEFLDPISPEYIADLVSWTAIGARSSESQLHRQLASGLSMPVGFKNGTGGSVHGAVNAIKAAGQVHTFLGITRDGRAAVVRTRGNPDCHVVLRGGRSGPNYSARHLAGVAALLDRAGLPRAIMVDCSHDNSGGKPEGQPAIVGEVLRQILAGNRAIIGIMLESNLLGGNQPPSPRRGDLRYGVSITDGCLDWASTARCLRETYKAMAPRFAPRAGEGAVPACPVTENMGA